MYYIIFIPLFLCVLGAIADMLGYFGPSDGAIDAYWKLKVKDPKKAKIFLNSLIKEN